MTISSRSSVHVFVHVHVHLMYSNRRTILSARRCNMRRGNTCFMHSIHWMSFFLKKPTKLENSIQVFISHNNMGKIQTSKQNEGKYDINVNEDKRTHTHTPSPLPFTHISTIVCAHHTEHKESLHQPACLNRSTLIRIPA